MKKVLFVLTVVQNTLIGRSKQSIGNATFTTWKGKNVLKSKPITVENPRTDGQVLQRLRMRAIVSAFRAMSSTIVVGFKERAVGMSEYNAFTKTNIIGATTVSLPNNDAINWPNLQVAMGTIYPTTPTSVTADDSDNAVVINYPTSPSDPGQSATDDLNVVYFNETQSYFRNSLGVAQRSTGTLSITDTQMVAGDVIHFYSFFSKADGSKESDSVYTAVTVVA